MKAQAQRRPAAAARAPPAVLVPAVAVGVGTLRLPELRPEHPREAAPCPSAGLTGFAPLLSPGPWPVAAATTPLLEEERPAPP
ncbi:hypothetical protein A6R68_00669, partial [Neotoma lepida]